MGEELARHQVVRLNSCIDISAVNSESDTHDHVLRAFHNAAAGAHQVSAVKCLEAEVIVAVVAVINDRRVQAVFMLNKQRNCT